LKVARYIFLFFIALSSLNSKNISDQLKEYNDKLGEFNEKLSSISNEIIGERDSITSINRELQNIDGELSKDKKRYLAESEKLKIIQKDAEELYNQQQSLKENVIRVSTKLISLSILQSGDKGEDLNSIVFDEAFKVLTEQSNQELKNLEASLISKAEKISFLEKKIGELSESVSKIESKKRLMESKKKERETRFQTLENKKSEYKKHLNSLLQKQLDIKREIEEAQKKIAERDRSEKSVTVKDSGNSYIKEAVKRYRGKKTISPIQGYNVLTKFGTYIDPIYKIKIFSSSVVLQPKKPNSNVSSIFNGKITLIKDDKTLGKFVMIEHYNGLQTMYAHLDSFSPSIKVGKKIKVGTVIGRVSDRLYFEVMEKRYRIDPLEVIE
jgi:murein DD-endopeptidase MepM/ murein hydrolase activator NlpD